MRTKFGGLAPGLTFEQFVNHSSVQAQWRKQLGYGDLPVRLPISKISKSTFDKTIYQPLLARRTKHELATYRAKVSDFGPYGKHEEQGRRAYEAMVAPVLALFLSLIGALVHMGKTTLLTIQYTSRWSLINGTVKLYAIAGWVLACFMLAPKFIQTDLTSHPTYVSWREGVIDSSKGNIQMLASNTISGTLDSMIRLHSVGYPVFSSVRSGLNTAQTLMEKHIREHIDND